MPLQNIFQSIEKPSSEEIFQELAIGHEFKLERIVSTGQTTPAGKWCHQESNEWVVLLSGAAILTFQEPHEVLDMQPGDYVCIKAHRRHRVDWTDPTCETVWLALHYRNEN